MSVALLLKESDDDYARLFSESGWKPLFVPPLQFETVNVDVLERKIRLAEHSGLVLTSPRAVEACAAAAPRELFAKWSRKPVFVVGKTTERRASQLLGLSSAGSDCGNADSLSDLIVSRRNELETKPLFFPSGNLKRETLPKKLKLAGIELDALTVYETAKNAHLENRLRDLNSGMGVPRVLIFFSPSGVDHVLPVLTDVSYDFDKCYAVAIGPSTDAQIQKWKLKTFAVASAPTAECLLQILDQIN